MKDKRDLSEVNTLHEQTEEALRSASRKLELALHSANAGTWDWHIATGILDWSKELYQLFGIDENIKATFDAWRNVLHPEDLKLAERRIEEALNNHTSLKSEYRIVLPNGEVRWIEALGEGIYDEEGSPIQMNGICLDITERRENIEQMKRLNERISLAAKAGKIGIWDWDIVNNKLEWDDRMYELYGCSRDQFGGAYETWLNSIHPEDKNRCDEESARAVRGEADYDTEFRIILPNGKIRWLKANADIFRDEKGNIVRQLGVNFDITERKRSEETLRNVNETVHSLLNGISESALLIDPNGIVLASNETAANRLKTDLNNFIGYNAYDFILPTLRAERKKRVMQVVESAKPQRFEDERLGRFIDNSLTPILDEGGKVTGIVVVGIDITERKLAEEEVRKSREEFKNYFEMGPVGMCVTSLEKGWVEVNDKLCDMFGYTKEEFSKFTWADVTHPDDLNSDLELFNEVIEGKRDKYELDKRFIRKDGSTVYTTLSVTCQRNNDGNVHHFLALLMDITERKLEEEERKANLELLHIINQANSKEALIHDTITFLKGWMNCDAVGIRLKEGDDYPYYETSGFPARFVKAEKYLCSYNSKGEIERDSEGNAILECMCGNIICERFDPEFSFFTTHGSFWSNGTTKLLASTTEEERQARTRNRCNGEGYESVGLFPLRFAGETFGLLQINDRKEGLFTNRNLAILERFGDNLAIAMKNHLAAEMLEQSEGKLKAIAQNISDTIIQSDRLGNITYINHFAPGLTKEQILSSKVFDFVPDEQRSIVQKALDTVFVNGKTNSYESIGPGPNGELRHYEVTASPIFEGNNISSAVFLARDITDRKLAEIELEKYRSNLEELVKARTEELDLTNEYLKREIEKEKQYEMMLQQSLDKEKELSEMKSRFVSTTSHEFRTPLTSVLSSNELLQRYGTTWSEEKKNEHFDRITNSVEYLTKLLDDVLTLSRTETGKISFVPEPIDLRKFAEDCIRDSKLLMNDRHEIEFEYNLKKKTFTLDPKLMKFIFNNLLSNGIKYSPGGGKINVKLSEDRKDLKIEFKDEGIGIAQEDLQKIFESFYRTKSVEGIGGTGLGLSIVKRAVDLHRGKIIVESQLGKGTNFTVTIPTKGSV